MGTTVENRPRSQTPARRHALRALNAPRRWDAAIGRPTGILDPRFSGLGLSVGSWFLAASLLPSLLPRLAVVQGVISGVALLLGYGVGATLAALWSYLGIPVLSGRPRSALTWLFVGIGLVLATLAGWKQVGWQNDLRTLYGMDPIGPGGWPVIITVTLVVAGAFLLAARSIRLVFRTLLDRLNRHMSAQLAMLLGWVLLLLAFWAIYTGVLVNGFFAAANAVFAPADSTVSASVEQPSSGERTGGPGSLVAWDTMGRDGRTFVSGGPTAEDIDAVTGGGAQRPVRVYVGLKSADTPQERADLVLAELKRTGAFDRKVLVLATTTGTGYLDTNGTDPIEYLWNGDTAIAGVQYSFLPSWISILADQEAVQLTSQVVFETVQDYWSTLPATDRPDLYLYGLSLGSYGVESVLGSINVINEPISGALLVGPPFVNPVHDQLVVARDPGSPAWLPVYGDGRTVRFTAEEDGFARTPGPWGPTRIAYLQHASDPVVFVSPDLAFTPPEWLRDGQRGPDVSPRMGWFPLVTMVQVILDMAGAGEVPMGYGHLYSATANLHAWEGVTQAPGWTPEKLANLSAVLESHPHPYAGAR